MLRELSAFLVLLVLMVSVEGQRQSPERNSDGSVSNAAGACKPVTCKKHCEFGFRVENGCEVCGCKDNPSAPDPANCPAIDHCDNRCHHGYQTDEHGCSTCRCRTCPPICQMYCKHGFKKDSTGCDICSCREVPFNRTHGGSGGHGHGHGHKNHHDRKSHNSGNKDHHHGSRMGHRGEHHKPDSHRPGRHGGSEVRCKPRRCPNRCPNGFAKDSFGCRTCACNQAARSDASQPVADPCGNRPMCTMHCELGFQKGSDGCDMCKCVEAAPKS